MIYCFWNATCKLSGVFVCRFVSLLNKRRKDHEAKKAAAAAAAGDGEQGLSSTTRSSQTTGKCLCSYYFPLYSACSHLTLRGHVTSNNEILFPPKVSDSAAKFSFTSARSLITWHLTVKLFSVKSLRISSLFVNFVVAEIFPGNGLLTSKSETVYFLNSAFEQWRWRMKMHCYPRMLNATFAAILDLLTSLLCHTTRPFHSSSSTQHLSKTALVVID